MVDPIKSTLRICGQFDEYVFVRIRHSYLTFILCHTKVPRALYEALLDLSHHRALVTIACDAHT